MANTQHVQFSDENGDIYYLENQTEDVRDTSGKPLSNGGDLSEASVKFTADTTRKLPQSGGRFKAFLGSIVKYLSDLGAAAFMSVANNDTTNRSDMLSTAQVAYQHGKEIDQLNSELNEISNGQAVKTSNIVSDASSENGTMRYMVKSGVCYVVAEFSPIESSEQVLPLFTGLPIPFWGVVYTSGGNNHGTSMTFAVDADGVFKKYYSGVKTSDRYDLCFSYPVAQ